MFTSGAGHMYSAAQFDRNSTGDPSTLAVSDRRRMQNSMRFFRIEASPLQKGKQHVLIQVVQGPVGRTWMFDAGRLISKMRLRPSTSFDLNRSYLRASDLRTFVWRARVQPASEPASFARGVRKRFLQAESQGTVQATDVILVQQSIGPSWWILAHRHRPREVGWSTWTMRLWVLDRAPDFETHHRVPEMPGSGKVIPLLGLLSHILRR